MATEAPQTASEAPEQPDRPDVFISYSRQDKPFVKTRLLGALAARGKDVWIDLEDIPPAADWRERIWDGIEAARAFVFVLSPSSLRSEVCREELKRATRANKRLIPVLRSEVHSTAVPEELKRPNWIFLRDEDDFNAQFERLVEALETDLGWVDRHARLAVRAREWNRSGQDRSHLLRGSDLKAAERWQAEQGSRAEAPTPDQRQYIHASRQAASWRQHITLGAVAAALFVSLGLALLALVQRNQAVSNEKTARSRELAARADLRLRSDPAASVALAAEAARTKPTAEAETSLRTALARSHLRMVLRGHRGPVRTAVFSPDGHSILSGGEDGTARIWSAATGRRRSVLRLYRNPVPVTSADFHPDARRLLTTYHPGYRNVEAGVWTTRGRLLGALRPFGGIHTAEFERRGRLMVTGHSDGTARVWEARPSGRLLATMGASRRPMRTFPVSFAAFVPGHRQILTLAGSSLKLWPLRGGRRQATTLKGAAEDPADPDNPVGSGAIAVSPRGDRVALGGEGGAVSLWALRDGGARLLATLRGHTGPIQSLAFSPDGRRLATGAGEVAFGATDTTARVWSARTGRPLAVLKDHTAAIRQVAFSPDSAFVATASKDGSARVWETSTGQAVAALLGHRDSVSSVAFSPTGRSLVTASDDGSVRVWDAGTGASRSALPAQSTVGAAALSPDGRLLATGGDGAVQLWRFPSGARGASLAGFRGPVSSVQFDRAGRLLLAASHDGTARLWSIARHPKLRRVLHGHRGAITDAELSPDGRFAVTMSGALSPTDQVALGQRSIDGTVRAWDLRRRSPAATTLGKKNAFRVALSPDGHWLAIDRGTALEIWDTSDWRRVEKRRDIHIGGWGFSPDGSLLVTTSGTGYGYDLRDPATGRRLRTLRGTTEWSVTSLAFSPNGRLLVLGGFDGTARVWDVRSGKAITALRGHSGAVYRVAFDRGGRFVLTAGQDGSVRVSKPATGEEVVVFHGSGVRRANFSPDAHYVWTASGMGEPILGGDGTVRIYACELCGSLDDLLAVAARHVRRVSPAAG